MPSHAYVRPCSHSEKRQPSKAFASGAVDQRGARLARAAGLRQGRDPEPADERPDAAVVVLPGEVLLVARHVRAPQEARLLDRVRRSRGRERAHRPPRASAPAACARVARSSASPMSIASRLPNTSPSSPKNEKFTKREIERRGCARASARIARAAGRAGTPRSAAENGWNSALKLRMRVGRVRETVAPLHVVPERVACRARTPSAA